MTSTPDTACNHTTKLNLACRVCDAARQAARRDGTGAEESGWTPVKRST